MKKTCEGCRAYEYINNCDRTCALGYYQDYGTPMEQCPKPRTIKELIKCLKNPITTHLTPINKNSK